MKRISIAIGSLIVLLVTSLGLGWDNYIIVVYAGLVETVTMIVMSIFGKNGNGQTKEPEAETTPTEELPK